ncbi:recombinase family protein [Geothrix mesophila]|uniref:recombinase family protein n=1 Tax=Geothrix mesophila TaxID=2922723 RepID=UPI001FAC00C4|nr:recombinase family protein [Geothrix sp. SG198]
MAKPEAHKAMRCAIYTRKSTAAGLEKDFNSLDAQREACEAYIKTRVHEGWEALTEPFDDGGYTGANTDRPAFQKLLTWISRKRVDVVVIYKVDRLSRSLVDFAQVMEHFNKYGIGFVSVTQHFSTTEPVGRLTLNMLMSFAEFEREMIAERIRDKIRATRLKGQWTGGNAPLGYRSERSHLLVHEEEAPWVKQIYQWYLEGVSALVIGQRLNEANVPLKTIQRPRPNPWTKDLVLRILRNRLYLGEISCQGEFVVAEHPGLIDQDTFDRVQHMLLPKNRRERHECRNPTYLMRGTLRCGHCGAAMTSASSFRMGRLHRYYRCSNRDKQGKKVCATRQLPAEAIEAFVVERIQGALEDPDMRPLLEAQLANLGLQAPKGGLSTLWEALTLPNRRRLIGLMVEEARVDQFKGKLSVRFRDLRGLSAEEEPHADH